MGFLGSLGRGIAGFATGGLSELAQSNPLTKALGLSGDQGEFLQAHGQNRGVEQMRDNNDLLNSAGHQDAMEAYRSGGVSSANALKGMGKAAQNDLATSATTGSKYATEQVQNNPILGKIFGAGGQQDKDLAYQNEAQDRERTLQNQGFKLDNNDREAYGQAAGDIGRMFGQQENKLAQSLASRGLSAGASGAAGAQFSGLAGNKNEMLAKSMTDIANQRMKNTMDRIGQQQSFISNLRNANNQTTQIGAGAINDQYKRQMAGAQNDQSNLNDLSQNSIAQNDSRNKSDLMSLQDKRGAKGKTLLEGLGNGLFSSASSIGAAPGNMLNKALGGGMMGG